MAAKVLLAEDDNNLREIYQARLMAEGYEITAAQNGEEALVLAKQHRPDLIISDVMMPRISGFEMLDILRNTDELKNTKVIMLTALGQTDDRGRADNLGADKYLVKSQVTLEDIVSSARELLGEGEAAALPNMPTEEPAQQNTPADPQTTPTPVAEEAASMTPQSENTQPVEPIATEPIVEPATPVAPVTEDATTPVTETVAAPQTEAVVAEPVAPPQPETEPEEVAFETPQPQAEEVSIPTTQLAEAEASVDASTPQTTESEEAALQDQINSLIGQDETPASAEQALQAPEAAELPVFDTASPEAPTQSEPVGTATEETTPEVPAEEASPITAFQPDTTSTQTEVATPQAAPENSTQTIEPLSDTTESENKPSLEDLVAKELAAEEAQKTAASNDPQSANQDSGQDPAQPRIINPDINNIAL